MVLKEDLWKTGNYKEYPVRCWLTLLAYACIIQTSSKVPRARACGSRDPSSPAPAAADQQPGRHLPTRPPEPRGLLAELLLHGAALLLLAVAGGGRGCATPTGVALGSARSPMERIGLLPSW